VLQRASLGALLLLLSAPPLFAQATGTINGRVVDQGDAVLPGVTINVKNTATGATRTTVTNAEGLYSLPALERGSYEITAELAGFAPATRRLELVAGSNITGDLKLGLAALQENVTVAGQVPLVETTQSLVSATIRQTEVAQLPMVNRSLAAMMTLLPGVREVAAAGSHGHAAGYVSFAGNTGRSYNMYVDGVDNKEDQDGGTLVQLSLDGIEEFRALGAGFQAEYGRGSTVVVLASKSGTSQFRGSGFLFGRNESLIATDYFSKPENGGLGKQPFKRMQFGGSFGGPVVRDRAWFFTSIERIHQDFQLPRAANIANELRVVKNALNLPIADTSSVPQPFRDLLFQTKVNTQLGRNHSVFGRYMSQYGHVDNPQVGAGTALWQGLQYNHRNNQSLWSASGGWTWVVSNTAVNEFRGQYAYYLHDDKSGRPCLDTAVCVPLMLSFPSVTTAFPGAYTFAHPSWVNYETKVEVMDNFSKQVGRHSLKTGIDYARLPTFYANLQFGSPGSIAFFDDPSVIVNNTNGRYPLGFQTPGIVRTIATSSLQQVDGWSNQAWFMAAFAQDDWKLTPRVTVNLGVRYDINEMSNNCCWAKNRTYQILKAIGHPYGALPQTDKNNVAPRLGVAWDIKGDGKNVARGSFGLFYATGIITSVYGINLQSQDAVYVTSTAANSTIGSGQLANYVYGVSPLPPAPPFAPTQFQPGQNSGGSWFSPDFKDALSQNTSVGLSHLFASNTVLSADYLHVRLYNGWNTEAINPLIVDPNNPAGPRVRALAADLQRVFGDPNLLGPTTVLTSRNWGLYDAVDFHFERRFPRTALQVNYTLAWARGTLGSMDFTTQGDRVAPTTCTSLGCPIDPPYEWGPTSVDERHRVTVAGIVPLPLGFDVAPSFTAATARPYTQYRAPNPNGNGFLRILSDDGVTPVGPYNARGKALINANARVTKHITMARDQQISLFAEFYNIFNRANFGNSYGTLAFAPATYNQPTGYLGGIGSTTTIPISFQVQFGARYTF
jgi:carboxypeptidase family protein/TonB-dependent receptor-like protein